MVARSLFDCVIVNDEVALLELRLRLLGDHVDHFVVVEATHDFRGRPKPAYVRDSGLLAGRQNVTHIVVSDLNSIGGDDRVAAFGRERRQRDAIAIALGSLANRDDVALVCDADEIPSPAGVARLRSITSTVRLAMRHSFIYANLWTSRVWAFPFACPVGTLIDQSPHDLRFSAHSEKTIDDMGWHLSYLGRASPRKKFSTTAHVELDRGYLKSNFHLCAVRVLGVHPATTFKILYWTPPERLPEELLSYDVITDNIMRKRGRLRAVAAVVYAAGVSVLVDENWALRAARDKVREIKRNIVRVY